MHRVISTIMCLFIGVIGSLGQDRLGVSVERLIALEGSEFYSTIHDLLNRELDKIGEEVSAGTCLGVGHDMEVVFLVLEQVLLSSPNPLEMYVRPLVLHIISQVVPRIRSPENNRVYGQILRHLSGHPLSMYWKPEDEYLLHDLWRELERALSVSSERISTAALPHLRKLEPFAYNYFFMSPIVVPEGDHCMQFYRFKEIILSYNSISTGWAPLVKDLPKMCPEMFGSMPEVLLYESFKGVRDVLIRRERLLDDSSQLSNSEAESQPLSRIQFLIENENGEKTKGWVGLLFGQLTDPHVGVIPEIAPLEPAAYSYAVLESIGKRDNGYSVGFGQFNAILHRYPVDSRWRVVLTTMMDLCPFNFGPLNERKRFFYSVGQGQQRVVTIRRDHLLEDSFGLLDGGFNPNLLRVEFENEPNIDQTREWIRLVLADLLDPTDGIFEPNPSLPYGFHYMFRPMGTGYNKVKLAAYVFGVMFRNRIPNELVNFDESVFALLSGRTWESERVYRTAYTRDMTPYAHTRLGLVAEGVAIACGPDFLNLFSSEELLKMTEPPKRPKQEDTFGEEYESESYSSSSYSSSSEEEPDAAQARVNGYLRHQYMLKFKQLYSNGVFYATTQHVGDRDLRYSPVKDEITDELLRRLEQTIGDDEFALLVLNDRRLITNLMDNTSEEYRHLVERLLYVECRNPRRGYSLLDDLFERVNVVGLESDRLRYSRMFSHLVISYASDCDRIQHIGPKSNYYAARLVFLLLSATPQRNFYLDGPLSNMEVGCREILSQMAAMVAKNIGIEEYQQLLLPSPNRRGVPGSWREERLEPLRIALRAIEFNNFIQKAEDIEPALIAWITMSPIQIGETQDEYDTRRIAFRDELGFWNHRFHRYVNMRRDASNFWESGAYRDTIDLILNESDDINAATGCHMS